MQVRKIRKNSEGASEWCFGHSAADYVSGQYQIAQDIYTALYEWKYDCFFALENGIDWNTRLGKTNQKELLDADIKRTIENRIGVISVLNFTSTLIDRHYSCNCGVFTEFTNEPITIEFSI